MILERLYQPNEGELIYHYCRAEAFLEIIKSRTIWQSAYYVLNDSMEREWGYSIFTKVAKQLHDEIGEASETFLRHIDAIARMAYSSSMAMISSYSLDGDVLSQWRAYADNGRGFAIGFSAKLMQMPAKQLRVLYDKDTQIRELLGNLKHIYEYEKSIGFKFDDQFQSHCANLALDLCAYKNPAFREEKEIRLVHVSGVAPEGQSKKIVALGARDQDGKRLSDPIEIRFRISDGVAIPYVVLDYTNGRITSPIKEVVLGPRNENSTSNIGFFLNTIGMLGVTIRRSSASYR